MEKITVYNHKDVVYNSLKLNKSSTATQEEKQMTSNYLHPVRPEDQLTSIDLEIISMFNWRNFRQRLNEDIDSEFNQFIIKCTIKYLESMNL